LKNGAPNSTQRAKINLKDKMLLSGNASARNR